MHAMQALSSGVRVAAKAARPAQRRTAVVVRAEGGIEKKVRLCSRLRSRHAPRTTRRAAWQRQRSLGPQAGVAAACAAAR